MLLDTYSSLIKIIQKDKNQKEKEEIIVELIPPEKKDPKYHENIDLKSELDIEFNNYSLNNNNGNKKEENKLNIDSEEEDNLIRFSNVIAKTSAGAGEAVIKGVSVAVSTALRVVGIGFIAIGCIVGVGTGAYFTSKHCEEIIDKFAKFYKENVENINYSFLEANAYLESISES